MDKNVTVIDLGNDESFNATLLHSHVVPGSVMEFMLLAHDGDLLLAEQMLDEEGTRCGLAWTTKEDRGYKRVLRSLSSSESYGELYTAASKFLSH